jgi:hypothetical protein
VAEEVREELIGQGRARRGVRNKAEATLPFFMPFSSAIAEQISTSGHRAGVTITAYNRRSRFFSFLKHNFPELLHCPIKSMKKIHQVSEQHEFSFPFYRIDT